MVEHDSVDLLTEFRAKHGLSVRKAATQLHVSHVTLRAWERRSLSPSEPYREAIERWSGGAVPANRWPLSEREKTTRENAALVVAAETGDEPAPTSSANVTRDVGETG